MMTKRHTAVLTGFALLGLSACATTSAPSTSASTTTSTAQQAAEPKAVAGTTAVVDTKTANAEGGVICKRQAVIGSKFKKKVCGTAEQWEAFTQESRDKTRALQRSAASRGSSN